jgi:hypothetical protein
MDAIIKKSSKFYDILFVTDLRFKNEADFIKGIGGYVVNVERRVQEDPEEDMTHTHVSEKDMDDYSDFDYVLNNDKTEPELRESIEKMFLTLKILKNAA